MEERMKELSWAVNALVGFLFVQRRTVAGNLADVGEDFQQPEFGLDEFWVVEGLAAAKRVVLRENDACAVGAHVVTGDQARSSCNRARASVRGVAAASVLGWLRNCTRGTASAAVASPTCSIR